VAFSLPNNHIFWNILPEPLPVEIEDYRVEINTTGWTIIGDHKNNNITLVTSSEENPDLGVQSVKDRFLEFFSRKPRRPKNIEGKYFRSTYCSNRPYGINLSENKRK